MFLYVVICSVPYIVSLKFVFRKKQLTWGLGGRLVGTSWTWLLLEGPVLRIMTYAHLKCGIDQSHYVSELKFPFQITTTHDRTRGDRRSNELCTVYCFFKIWHEDIVGCNFKILAIWAATPKGPLTKKNSYVCFYGK